MAEVTIEVRPNGPYIVNGSIELHDANGHDLKDPLLSPVYGDMHGFPPTILRMR